MIRRRGLLLGMLAAPVIVRPGLVMPIKPLPVSVDDLVADLRLALLQAQNDEWLTAQNVVSWPSHSHSQDVRWMLNGPLLFERLPDGTWTQA